MQNKKNTGFGVLEVREKREGDPFVSDNVSWKACGKLFCPVMGIATNSWPYSDTDCRSVSYK
jgi:hypothetical protein